MRILTALMTICLHLGPCFAAEPGSSATPSSPPAVEARQRFDATAAKAQEAYAKAMASARDVYASALQKGRDAAMKDANDEEANWYDRELKNIKSGLAPSSEQAKRPFVASAQAAFTVATEKANEDRFKTIDAARRQYLAGLEIAKRTAMVDKKNLDEANRITAEMEKFKTWQVDDARARGLKLDSQKKGSANAAQEPVDLRGLKMEWFTDAEFRNKTGERVDYKIATCFGDGGPGPGCWSNYFAVRWSGYIRAPRPGRYKLLAIADDGFRMKLDGKPVMDSWNQIAWQNALVELTGAPQEICFEMHENRWGAAARLQWVPPGESVAVPVPPSAFYQTFDAARAGRWVRPFGTGLAMTVYQDRELQVVAARDFDDNIDWDLDQAPIASRMPPDQFSIRWEGFIVAPEPGTYRLHIVADDGVRLWVAGNLLVDSWKPGNSSQAVTVELDGTPQPIVLNYFDFDRYAVMSLHWSKVDGFEEHVIPPSAFFCNRAVAEQAIARRREQKGK